MSANKVVSNKDEDSTLKTRQATLQETFSKAEAFDVLLMCFGSLGSIVSGASLPAFCVLMGQVLDDLNKGNSLESSVNQSCIAFIIVAGINVVSGLTQVMGWSISGERQSAKFKSEYVHAILSQEVGWFDTCGAGELSTKVSDLGGKLQDGLTRKVSELLQNSAEFILSFIVALYMCWQLTVVLLASFPLIGISAYFMIQAVASAQNESASQYAQAGGLATETLSAIRTVTALNDQPNAIARYRGFVLEAMEIGLFKSLKVGLGNGVTFFVSFGTYALGFWYGAKLIADQQRDNCTENCLSGGTVITVFFCIIIGANALGQIVPPLSAFTAARVSIASMLDVINRVPLIDGLSDTGLKPTEKPKGEITVSSVQFAYPSRPNLQICKDYNLTIKAGQTVALCGPSGAGKSTVINLLLRFYDPQSGSIELDGVNVKDLNVRWLRSCIGYVGQEPVLFAGTIAENIAYGIDRQVDIMTDEELRERVYEAAKQANAHDFISAFPKGYETDVGGSGSSLSGGQKQRIAIARALIKRPAVLLLDEATSALDAASERMVQSSIDALQSSHAQTTIVIAHRLSTIRNADKIAVVAGGIIAELGTHDELFVKDGLYADLVRLQMSGHEDDHYVKKEGEEQETGTTAATAGAGIAKDTSAKVAVAAESTATSLSDVPLDIEQGVSVAAAAIPGSVEGAGAKPATAESLHAKDPELKKKMWALVYPHAHWLAFGILGAALVGGAFPIWGLLLAETQDMYYLTDPDEIQKQSVIVARDFVLLGIECLLGYTLQYYCVARVGEAVSAQLRSSMFESLLRRDIAYFDDEKNSVGALTTRLANDARLVHEGTGEALSNQLQAMFTLFIGIVIAFTASWKISLVVIVTFPITVAAAAIKMKAKTGQFGDSEGLTSGGQGAIISAAFVHMRTVSAFSMQHAVSARYNDEVQTISKERQGRSLYFGAGLGFSNATRFLTYALLFWYGAQLILHDGLTFVQLMTAMMALMLGALGLGQALNEIGDQKEGIEAAHRIFTMIADGERSPIDGLSTAGTRPSEAPRGRIELKGVQFAYPARPDVQVCRDYNLTIEAGELVALVGPSGAGKSTIMNLLLRFYDPKEGQVFLDEVDISTLNVRWLRSQIGYVGQEPVLFSGSVAENIAKGRPSHGEFHLLSLDEVAAMAKAAKADKAASGGNTSKQHTSGGGYHNVYTAAPVASAAAVGDIEMGGVDAVPVATTDGPSEGYNITAVDEDIVSACVASNAHEFIQSFPQGYATDVGEGSVMVSGGQKQRIAIARALIKRPAVLLLDEATSALDAASERMVQASIDALQSSHAQTTIVIAHRLSTIRNADKIAVIDQGRVVEIGTHEQLLAQHGLYEELWNKQTGVTVPVK